jgi:hypothetical protein
MLASSEQGILSNKCSEGLVSTIFTCSLHVISLLKITKRYLQKGMFLPFSVRRDLDDLIRWEKQSARFLFSLNCIDQRLYQASVELSPRFDRDYRTVV